jgi:hypothetical protein
MRILVLAVTLSFSLNLHASFGSGCLNFLATVGQLLTKSTPAQAFKNAADLRYLSDEAISALKYHLNGNAPGNVSLRSLENAAQELNTALAQTAMSVKDRAFFMGIRAKLAADIKAGQKASTDKTNTLISYTRSKKNVNTNSLEVPNDPNDPESSQVMSWYKELLEWRTNPQISSNDAKRMQDALTDLLDREVALDPYAAKVILKDINEYLGKFGSQPGQYRAVPGVSAAESDEIFALLDARRRMVKMLMGGNSAPAGMPKRPSEFVAGEANFKKQISERLGAKVEEEKSSKLYSDLEALLVAQDSPYMTRDLVTPINKKLDELLMSTTLRGDADQLQEAVDAAEAFKAKHRTRLNQNQKGLLDKRLADYKRDLLTARIGRAKTERSALEAKLNAANPALGARAGNDFLSQAAARDVIVQDADGALQSSVAERILTLLEAKQTPNLSAAELKTLDDAIGSALSSSSYAHAPNANELRIAIASLQNLIASPQAKSLRDGEKGLLAQRLDDYQRDLVKVLGDGTDTTPPARVAPPRATAAATPPPSSATPPPAAASGPPASASPPPPVASNPVSPAALPKRSAALVSQAKQPDSLVASASGGVPQSSVAKRVKAMIAAKKTSSSSDEADKLDSAISDALSPQTLLRQGSPDDYRATVASLEDLLKHHGADLTDAQRSLLRDRLKIYRRRITSGGTSGASATPPPGTASASSPPAGASSSSPPPAASSAPSTAMGPPAPGPSAQGAPPASGSPGLSSAPTPHAGGTNPPTPPPSAAPTVGSPSSRFVPYFLGSLGLGAGGFSLWTFLTGEASKPDPADEQELPEVATTGSESPPTTPPPPPPAPEPAPTRPPPPSVPVEAPHAGQPEPTESGPTAPAGEPPEPSLPADPGSPSFVAQENPAPVVEYPLDGSAPRPAPGMEPREGGSAPAVSSEPAPSQESHAPASLSDARLPSEMGSSYSSNPPPAKKKGIFESIFSGIGGFFKAIFSAIAKIFGGGK